MNKRVSIVLLALLAIAAVASIGVYEYRAGVARGLEMSGKLPVAPGGWGYPYWVGHWRPFGFVFPLLLVILIFAFARRLFWWGPFGGWRYGRRDLPAQFEQWHRKAHEQMADGESR
jgi:hypothetical protein